MSTAEEVVREIVRINGGDAHAPIHRDILRELTMPRYFATGANGALFGFRRPLMVKEGDLRYLTDAARTGRDSLSPEARGSSIGGPIDRRDRHERHHHDRANNEHSGSGLPDLGHTAYWLKKQLSELAYKDSNGNEKPLSDDYEITRVKTRAE